MSTSCSFGTLRRNTASWRSTRRALGSIGRQSSWIARTFHVPAERVRSVTSTSSTPGSTRQIRLASVTPRALGNSREPTRHGEQRRAVPRPEKSSEYSLRALWLHAPFVRNIYLVTADQRPDWLDDSDDRITLVSHAEIFPDSDMLPTFNSHAIEACLHRIPGLSEHFIYMNDDVFFGREVSSDLFYTKAAKLASDWLRLSTSTAVSQSLMRFPPIGPPTTRCGSSNATSDSPSTESSNTSRTPCGDPCSRKSKSAIPRKSS